MSDTAVAQAQELIPRLQGHTVGFADSLAVSHAMAVAINKAGFPNSSIVVLHGEKGIQLLEGILDGSSWGESAETIRMQGAIELGNGHCVVCVDVHNAEEADTVAAVSTQCGVRSIYHFGMLVDTRLTP